MFPVRCYTCNSTIGQHFPSFRDARRQGVSVGAYLDEIGLRRLCCRRMFLGHVDNIEDQIKFANKDTVMDANGTRLRRFVKHTRTVVCD